MDDKCTQYNLIGGDICGYGLIITHTFCKYMYVENIYIPVYIRLVNFGPCCLLQPKFVYLTSKWFFPLTKFSSSSAPGNHHSAMGFY